MFNFRNIILSHGECKKTGDMPVSETVFAIVTKLCIPCSGYARTAVKQFHKQVGHMMGICLSEYFVAVIEPLLYKSYTAVDKVLVDKLKVIVGVLAVDKLSQEGIKSLRNIVGHFVQKLYISVMAQQRTADSSVLGEEVEQTEYNVSEFFFIGEKIAFVVV